MKIMNGIMDRASSEKGRDDTVPIAAVLHGSGKLICRSSRLHLMVQGYGDI